MLENFKLKSILAYRIPENFREEADLIDEQSVSGGLSADLMFSDTGNASVAHAVMRSYGESVTR
jgi:hypothetical protein